MKEFVDKLIERLEEKERMLLGNSGDIGCTIGITNAMACAIEIVKDLASEHNNGWIPCEKELPVDCDNRFYMCIVENHEEDLPMFCQYDEDYGFGFWHDYYDEHTYSEFKTNEELGYEKVIAWQPIPKFSAPYKKGE